MFRLIFLALVMLVSAGSAESRWREASTRHFLVYSEGTEAELRQAAEDLERYDSMLRAATGVRDPERSPSTRVRIFYVRDSGKVRELAGARDSGIWGFYVPHNAGGVIYSPRIDYREARRDSLHRFQDTTTNTFTAQRVLLHEYTHHFMFNNFNFGAPLWLSEGYPELFSTAKSNPDGSMTIGEPPAERGHEISSAADINPKHLLLNPEANRRVPNIYAIGWLMSHYLTLHPDHQGRELLRYYQALSAGQSPEQAASVFGDLDQLTNNVREYYRRRQYPLAQIPATRLSTGPIVIREVTPGEDAIMEVRMRSKRGVNLDQARSLVRDARRIAAQHPNDPVVQVALAEAEFDARNWDAAEAAADQVIALSPNMVDGHLYKARSIWERAEAAQNKTPETWREVRRILAAANRLDPGNPEPLLYFYESYEASGTEPTENAVEGLINAHELAPQARGMRVLAVREMLRKNDAQRAALAWGPLVGGGHSGEYSADLDAITTMIRARDTRGALTKLDELRAKWKREEEENDG